MAVITGANGGSLVEIMAQALDDLKTEQNFLTSKLEKGNKLSVQMANNRGFRIALDYTRNFSVGYMDADGGNLAGTSRPNLDTMTATLQYLQFGQEISNLQVANSAPGMRVGPTAKAIAAKKLLQRRAEIEEYYFCRGNGLQTLAIQTGGTQSGITAGSTYTLTCSGAADGIGAYLLNGTAVTNGQRVRIYASDGTTFKHQGTITAKTSNTSVSYTVLAGSTVSVNTIVAGDLIYPQSDSTTPIVTALKGLPYLEKTSGAFFDKTLSTVPALQGVIDASTTTLSRTTMEALYRNSQARTGKKNPNQRCVTGLAQMSNYYVQNFTAWTPAQNVWGDGNRPGVDLGSSGTPNDYTFWGQPIDCYAFVHPANWWYLDYSNFYRLTLKDAGPMLLPAGQYVQKVSGGEYANAMQSWDDDYIEFLTDKPFANAGFTALTFSSLPGLLVNTTYTGNGV